MNVAIKQPKRKYQPVMNIHMLVFISILLFNKFKTHRMTEEKLL